MDPVTLALAKGQMAIEQAERADKPVVDLRLNGTLRDSVTGRNATFTGPAKTHPITGLAVSANTPAYAGGTPQARPPFIVMDSDVGVAARSAVGAFSYEGKVFGSTGADAASMKTFGYKAYGGADEIVTLYTFADQITDMWLTARGSFIVCTQTSSSESNASQDGGKLWRSTDGGSSWTKVLDIAAGASFASGFDSVGDLCYFCEYGGRTAPNNARHVYRSFDDGTTWTEVADFGQVYAGKDLHVHFVRIDPYSIGDPMELSSVVVYVGTGDGDEVCGLHRSTDGGETWSTVCGGSQAERFTNAAFDAEYVYLAGDGYVGAGQRYGIYRLRKSDDRCEKMLDVAGPVYAMATDAYSTIWACSNVERRYPSTPDPLFPLSGGTAGVYMLTRAQRDKWHMVQHFEGSGTYGGVLSLWHDVAIGLVGTTYRLDATPEHGCIVWPHRGSGLFIGPSDAVAFPIPMNVTNQFTVICAVELLTNLKQSLPSGNQTIITVAGSAYDYFHIRIASTSDPELHRLQYWVRKTGQSVEAISMPSVPMLAGDTMAVALRVDGPNVHCYWLNGRTRKLFRRAIAGYDMIPVTRLDLGSINGGTRLNQVLSNVQLFNRLLGDSEILNAMHGILGLS